VEPYLSLRESIVSKFSRIFKNNRKSKTRFFALKDINFQVNEGEKVGIIGSNGAGKSTLLKIISRITPPTKGRAILNGRVSSLLEVGTGFHPELTGRENIYLNGSILGLKKKEINEHFEEIVNFSGVETFIDTPLKKYSSGMEMRLAFSVAAFLQSEILLIDEVLSVGDAEFQKKCMNKMEELNSSAGRTIMFVSHNMDAIRKFCSRVLLINQGELIMDGNPSDVIGQYLSRYLKTKKEQEWANGKVSYENSIKVNKVWLQDQYFQKQERFTTAEPIGIGIDYEVLHEGSLFTHGLNVFNEQQVNIFNSHDVTSNLRLEKRKKGKYKALAWVPAHLLPEGMFTFSIALFSPSPLDIFLHLHDVLIAEVYNDFSQFSTRGDYTGDYGGLVRPLIKWESEYLDSITSI
jgi:ABC-type polysaccharide/polyol phosphate transport system, ATPase component